MMKKDNLICSAIINIHGVSVYTDYVCPLPNEFLTSTMNNKTRSSFVVQKNKINENIYTNQRIKS